MGTITHAPTRNGSAQSEAQGVREAFDTLKEDVRTVGADVGDLATEIKSEAQRQLSAARLEAKHRADAIRTEAKQRIKAARTAATIRAASAAEAVEETVRERPAAALGIAAGIGFLIGLLVAARR